MPEIDSSTRSLIGWLKLKSTPGRSSVTRIASTISSFERFLLPLTVGQAASGFMITNVSDWFGASSSVPSSG